MLHIQDLFESLSKTEREALKAIYRLVDAAGADGEAHTGAVADRMGVSPATVTATVKRLADRGLVDHTPYISVTLTDSGRVAAVAAIRRHRIVERFLADMLGYPWNEADRHAAAFEHDLPQEVEDRIFVALHRPETCPHGFPIPAKETGVMEATPPLYDLEPGEVAIVAVPGGTDPEIVEFLDTLGLRPGVTVLVKEKHPFDGPLVLSVAGKERTLGSTVANQVYVRRTA